MKVTNGCGLLAETVIEGRGEGARLRVESIREVPRGPRAWVLVGPPEGTRGDWLVEKLAELGVERFQPIDGARGRWTGGAARMKRWSRLADAALRQSRRTWRMEVAEPARLSAVIDRLPAGASAAFADAHGDPAHEALVADSGLQMVAVGPAGGFSASEVAELRERGWRAVRLAGGVLRSETAALAWAALWAAKCQ